MGSCLGISVGTSATSFTSQERESEPADDWTGICSRLDGASLKDWGPGSNAGPPSPSVRPRFSGGITSKSCDEVPSLPYSWVEVGVRSS